MDEVFAEIKNLVKDMVKIPSINSTGGERDISIFIEKWFKELPYFKENPKDLFIQELGDDLGRRNVFALVRGSKIPERAYKDGKVPTIIFHGHTDTVGIEDFGSYKELAFDSDALMKAYSEADIGEEAKKDLASGDWMFGRGATDMKDGDAVFMYVAKYFSEHRDDFAGNILLSFNPVEENMHSGMIKAIDFFTELAKKENLRYIFAINNDYTCPLYKGDSHRYIYTGAVGKLLPCFYIQGKETHAGQCFEGIDSSMVAASLVREISLNPNFCDSYNGEFSLPPAVLKCQDLKDFYNVQTPFSNFVYFNYMIHNDSVKQIEEKLLAAAEKSWKEVLSIHRERFESFCKQTGFKSEKTDFSFKVMTFDKLKKEAEKYCNKNLDKEIESIVKKEMKLSVDKREIALHIVQYLCKKGNLSYPLIILFFAPPYCPHNTLKLDIEEESNLYFRMKNFIENFGKEKNIDYRIMNFYPSLTDSSFIKIDDDEESIKKLMGNAPAFTNLFQLNLQSIKKLNIPAFNFGGFGKDAHKRTERVFMPYTFKTLPELEIKTVQEFLK